MRLGLLLIIVGGLLAGGEAQAQDMVRVRHALRTLTAPALHGRGYVQRGDQRAAAYLQRRFRTLGLQPLTPAYTQSFPLTVNTFPGALSLRAGATRLRPGYDFIAAPASGAGTVDAPVYQLDTLVFTTEAARRFLLVQNLRGQVLVLRHADAVRLSSLPPNVQQQLATAAAWLTLEPEKLTASLAAEQAPQPRLHVLAAAWPTQSTRVRLQVDAQLLTNYQTQNIVGLLPGTTQPDSLLVVTAHYDHLGTMGRRTYFPGANDNASGTAMLLELAAYYAQPQNRLPYSLLFIAFSGEEAGLIGSAYFVAHPLVELPRIRFLLNLDLLGTGEAGITVVNGRVWPTAFQRLLELNATGRFVPSILPRGPAANSDHYPFAARNVPAFFLYTRGGPTAYHDIHDQAASLPLTAFPGVFKLIIGFLGQL